MLVLARGSGNPSSDSMLQRPPPGLHLGDPALEDRVQLPKEYGCGHSPAVPLIEGLEHGLPIDVDEPAALHRIVVARAASVFEGGAMRAASHPATKSYQSKKKSCPVKTSATRVSKRCSDWVVGGGQADACYCGPTPCLGAFSYTTKYPP